MKRISSVWLSALCFAAVTAHAQSFPAKPVRIIVPIAPGSTLDIMARIIAPRLTVALGQPVLIENRPGAGGGVGIEATARAPKDGYTMVLAAMGLAIIPALNSRLTWDPVRDFAPVTQVAAAPLVIIVHPGVPAKTLQELVALARAQPGKLRYGHVGIGSSQHMAGQLFGVAAGVDIVDVPYKGNEEALADVLADRIEINFQGVSTVISQIRAGKVRAIAVTGPKRPGALPEVPTMIEAGLPAATVNVWYGLLAPAGTPRDIVQRLNTDVLMVMKNPEVIDGFAKGGADVATNTPDEFARMIRDDVATWAKVVKQRGIKVE